jgi:hypothetical protein
MKKQKRKVKVVSKRMNETLGDDMRYFRRHIAVFYESIKDPYDPAYLHMDQYGNVL